MFVLASEAVSRIGRARVGKVVGREWVWIGEKGGDW